MCRSAAVSGRGWRSGPVLYQKAAEDTWWQYVVPGPVPTPALSVEGRLLLIAPAFGASLGERLVLGGGIEFAEGAVGSRLRLLGIEVDAL